MAGGHKTEALATIKYASIVPRETVTITLMIGNIMILKLSGDILNAYGQVPVTEKLWTTLGSEFKKMPDRLQ